MRKRIRTFITFIFIFFSVQHGVCFIVYITVMFIIYLYMYIHMCVVCVCVNKNVYRGDSGQMNLGINVVEGI